MTDVVEKTWACPKDGTGMAPMGRRGGAWRCPACKGVFIDVESMRQRRRDRLDRRDRPPVWTQVVVSVAVSVAATFLVRRIRRRLTS